jgi:hypothetical protein
MLFYLERRGKISNGLNALYVTKHSFGRKSPINEIEKNIGSIFG